MKKRLCIGIQLRTAAWEAVLEQLGVWFEEINYDATDLNLQYSVIILNKSPNRTQRKILKDYLDQKGSILEVGNSCVFTDSRNITSTNEKTIINDYRESFLSHISHVDVHSKVQLHNKSVLMGGLLHIEEHENKNLAYLGADVGKLLQKTGYARKRFFSPKGGHPDEIVSRTSKHELTQILKATLKELHFRRSLPYIEKWTSPASNPVFCFRIDSDYGDKESIDKLYQTINRHKKSATWFLHVEAHEDWLNHFHKFENQEIALHGYEHGTSDSYKKISRNVQLGQQALEKANFNSTGFCAPYGIWNKALKKTLSESNFDYSSEFTFGYDGLPLQPSDKDLPLQIPIHPICTGSLNRHQYSIEDMKGYFEHVFRSKLSRFEPALFYHHPMQTGLPAINHLMELSDFHKFKNLTFSQFSTFWKERCEFNFQAYLSEGRVLIENSTDPKKLIQVSFNHKEFDLIATEEDVIDLTKTSKLKYMKPYLPDPDVVSQMRTRNLRLLKTSLLDWKNRVRL